MAIDIRKKEGVLPVLLGLLALAALSYRFLFVPELRKVRDLREEVARKEAEVAETRALRTAVEESRDGGRESPGLRIRSWEERIPPGPEPGRLLAEISGQAVRHRLGSFGLTVVADDAEEAAPQEGAKGESAKGESASGDRKSKGAREVRYRMTFRSTYRDLAEFLDDVPRMRRLLSVRSVSIKNEEDAMAATVEVSAWHREAR
jgi:Tfp pilus assembly protein PilO